MSDSGEGSTDVDLEKPMSSFELFLAMCGLMFFIFAMCSCWVLMSWDPVSGSLFGNWEWDFLFFFITCVLLPMGGGVACYWVVEALQKKEPPISAIKIIGVVLGTALVLFIFVFPVVVLGTFHKSLGLIWFIVSFSTFWGLYKFKLI